MDRRGDELLERVRNDPDDGGAANALLSALFAGYPVEALRPLLHSSDERVVQTGAWLVSELGDGAGALVAELPALLAHPARRARFFGLDAVLMNAGPADAELLARAVMLVEDSDSAVRWKAMQFLARATTAQLAGALPAIPDAEVARLAAWLLNAGAEDATAALADDAPLTRRFAASAAARVSRQDPSALERAEQSDDGEVSAFARDFSPPAPGGRGRGGS
jgi:hypothetical protein